MSFDLTQPSMTSPDWATCLGSVRENFRAIVQGDSGLFTTGLPIAGGLNVTDGNFKLKGQRYQNFLIEITNTAGTIQHRIVSEYGSLGASNFVSQVTGASITLANTPTVDSTHDFASGLGIASTLAMFLVLNTAVLTLADFCLSAHMESFENVAKTICFRPVGFSSNVNGTTRLRPALRLWDATAAADFSINTTNITSGSHLYIRVQGFLP
jgi:hypothetical protein